MTQPRLGIAMIIDKMSTRQSKADVSCLKDAFDTVGFDVYTYNDGDSEVSYLFWIQVRISISIFTACARRMEKEMFS